MVKYFAAVICEKLANDIENFGKKNPDLEIVAISHANATKTTGFGGLMDWTAIVVYKEKVS